MKIYCFSAIFDVVFTIDNALYIVECKASVGGRNTIKDKMDHLIEVQKNELNAAAAAGGHGHEAGAAHEGTETHETAPAHEGTETHEATEEHHAAEEHH